MRRKLPRVKHSTMSCRQIRVAGRRKRSESAGTIGCIGFPQRHRAARSTLSLVLPNRQWNCEIAAIPKGSRVAGTRRQPLVLLCRRPTRSRVGEAGADCAAARSPDPSREESPGLEARALLVAPGWSDGFEFSFQLGEFFGNGVLFDDGSCCCDSGYVSQGCAISGCGPADGFVGASEVAEPPGPVFRDRKA